MTDKQKKLLRDYMAALTTTREKEKFAKILEAKPKDKLRYLLYEISNSDPEFCNAVLTASSLTKEERIAIIGTLTRPLFDRIIEKIKSLWPF